MVASPGISASGSYGWVVLHCPDVQVDGLMETKGKGFIGEGEDAVIHKDNSSRDKGRGADVRR